MTDDPEWDDLDDMPDLVDEEWDPEEDPLDGCDIIRAKWTIDGCSTLLEVAERFAALAEHYRAMHADGWRLTDPVADDYGYIKQHSTGPAGGNASA